MFEHDVDAGGKYIKFALFYGATLFLMKREWSCSHPYDPYVAPNGNEHNGKNSVKFRNFRLIVRIEACGSRSLHNVKVKMRSVKFRKSGAEIEQFGAFLRVFELKKNRVRKTS